MRQPSSLTTKSNLQARLFRLLPSKAIQAAAIVGSVCASIIGGVVLPMSTAYAYQYGTAVLADSPSWYVPVDESSGSSLAASAGFSMVCNTAGVIGPGGFVGGGTGRVVGVGSPAYAGCDHGSRLPVCFRPG
jgi:hypothetical protein